jgi:hypothetical protein
MLRAAPSAGAQRARALRAEMLVAVLPHASRRARPPLLNQLPATVLVVACGAVANPAANQESDHTMCSTAEVSEQVKREL